MFQDSDDGGMHMFDNSDISEVVTTTLSKETLYDQVSDAFAEIPVLHKGSICTLFEFLVKLFDWFSSHPSLSKEAFSQNLQL